MNITYHALNCLKNSYSQVPPEEGGILGQKNGIVCSYIHDGGSSRKELAIYEPDVDMLNRRISEWSKHGIEFAGMVHSHLPKQITLSEPDKEYIKMLFKSLPQEINKLYFPIFLPFERELVSYKAIRIDDEVMIMCDEINLV